MLANQATALQSLFTRLTEKALVAEYMDHFEAYMRMALRAQSQSRASIETLAAIKNPPVVFAKQANIAAGPQQVNNGTVTHATAARAGEIENTPSQLLEAPKHGQWLDTRAPSATGGANSQLEAVGTIDRAKDAGGQGPIGAARLQGRDA